MRKDIIDKSIDILISSKLITKKDFDFKPKIGITEHIDKLIISLGREIGDSSIYFFNDVGISKNAAKIKDNDMVLYEYIQEEIIRKFKEFSCNA